MWAGLRGASNSGACARARRVSWGSLAAASPLGVGLAAHGTAWLSRGAGAGGFTTSAARGLVSREDGYKACGYHPDADLERADEESRGLVAGEGSWGDASHPGAAFSDFFRVGSIACGGAQRVRLDASCETRPGGGKRRLREIGSWRLTFQVEELPLE